MNKKLLLVILCLLMLTGCYDYKELNTLAILSATSIDYQDGEYVVTAQEINPQAPDKTAVIQSPFFIYTSEGKTLQEAYREITMTSSKFLYSHHLQLLLISENVAKEKLSEIIDFYLRNPAIRTEFNVIIYKSDNPLEIITPITDISSASIVNTMMTNMKYMGTTRLMTFNELVEGYVNEREQLVVPAIDIINKEEDGESIENVESSIVKESYQLENLAVFKDNVLVGYLDKEEALTYNYLMNNIQNSVLTYQCGKDEYITLEIVSSKSEIKTKDGKIKIVLELEGNINESNCQIDLNKEKNVVKIQKEISDYWAKEITDNIKGIIKEYDSDIFGFLNIMYKNDYEEYKKIKDKQDYLSKLEISVDSKVMIKSSGNLVEGINEKD